MNARVWARTRTKMSHFHAFDVDHKAKCNKRIRETEQCVENPDGSLGWGFPRKTLDEVYESEIYTVCPKCEVLTEDSHSLI